MHPDDFSYLLNTDIRNSLLFTVLLSISDVGRTFQFSQYYQCLDLRHFNNDAQSLINIMTKISSKIISQQYDVRLNILNIPIKGVARGGPRPPPHQSKIYSHCYELIMKKFQVFRPNFS